MKRERDAVDLSMKAGQDLFQVSMMLEERMSAPSGLCREVGKLGSRFYLLNYARNKIERLTFGAYRYLYRSWKLRKAYGGSS
ncbi:MAG: hypothetical protein LBN96_04405 [Desulfovibrio sp.]|jgi:hypothetical protein|nr:hypothetical protein [Desulfovibrio sp.]